MSQKTNSHQEFCCPEATYCLTRASDEVQKEEQVWHQQLIFYHGSIKNRKQVNCVIHKLQRTCAWTKSLKLEEGECENNAGNNPRSLNIRYHFISLTLDVQVLCLPPNKYASPQFWLKCFQINQVSIQALFLYCITHSTLVFSGSHLNTLTDIIFEHHQNASEIEGKAWIVPPTAILLKHIIIIS